MLVKCIKCISTFYIFNLRMGLLGCNPMVSRGKSVPNVSMVEKVDNLGDIVGQLKHCQAMARKAKVCTECSYEVV